MSGLNNITSSLSSMNLDKPSSTTTTTEHATGTDTDQALYSVLNAIDAGRNIYISGVGGTGKSYLLKQIYAHYKTKCTTALTSTTGISAFNIEGITIHSWSKLIVPSTMPENIATWLHYTVKKLKKNKQLAQKYKQIKLLLIDEVSMLGRNYMDMFHCVACEMRNSTEPFGGIQVVFSGDMLQLPPVKDDYPFTSEIWPTLNLQYFQLTKAYRFDNNDWVELLHRARVGALTQTDITKLNRRVRRTHPTTTLPLDRPIILNSKNAEVDTINSEHLKRINTNEVIFQNIDYVERPNNASLLKATKGATSNLTLSSVLSPQDSVEEEEEPGSTKKVHVVDHADVVIETNATFPQEIEQQFIIDKTVTLKVGAQVMLLVNLDITRGLVNGSRGIVKGIRTNGATNCTTGTYSVNDPSLSIIIQFDDMTQMVQISPHSFTIEEDGIKYTRLAFPLRLAWAVTIHKCQGLTLAHAEIDIGKSIFCKGQSYVALSRCKSLEGTVIKSFDPSKMKPDPKALAFEQTFLATAIKL